MAVHHSHHCPHVTVVSADSSEHLYMYDNVNPTTRVRLNSIIDLIPYVFEYYRVDVFRINLPARKGVEGGDQQIVMDKPSKQKWQKVCFCL